MALQIALLGRAQGLVEQHLGRPALLRQQLDLVGLAAAHEQSRVGRAAARPPRLIDLTWGQGDHPKVTLVGKGVCFDTGGLDIKPVITHRFRLEQIAEAIDKQLATKGLTKTDADAADLYVVYQAAVSKEKEVKPEPKAPEAVTQTIRDPNTGKLVNSTDEFKKTGE